VKQFPAELYSEFFLDMLEVYNDFENGRLRFSYENSKHFVNSLFLWGGVAITKQSKHLFTEYSDRGTNIMAITRENYSPYQPPINVFRNNDEEVSQWCSISIERGKNILRLQSAWNVADVCSNILLGKDKIRRVAGLSVLTIKKLRRMLREQVAVQSNIQTTMGV
jgi:hypothetical protein